MDLQGIFKVSSGILSDAFRLTGSYDILQDG